MNETSNAYGTIRRGSPPGRSREARFMAPIYRVARDGAIGRDETRRGGSRSPAGGSETALGP
jgi:hypothetical protein